MTYRQVDMTVSLVLMVMVGAGEVLFWGWFGGWLFYRTSLSFFEYRFAVSAVFIAVINIGHFIYCFKSGRFNKESQDTAFYPRTKSETIEPLGGFYGSSTSLRGCATINSQLFRIMLTL